MRDIQCYPEMNREIVHLLRSDPQSPHDLYAAARIEELEKRAAKADEYEAAIREHKMHFSDWPRSEVPSIHVKLYSHLP